MKIYSVEGRVIDLSIKSVLKIWFVGYFMFLGIILLIALLFGLLGIL